MYCHYIINIVKIHRQYESYANQPRTWVPMSNNDMGRSGNTHSYTLFSLYTSNQLHLLESSRKVWMATEGPTIWTDHLKSSRKVWMARVGQQNGLTNKFLVYGVGVTIIVWTWCYITSTSNPIRKVHELT